MSKTILRIIAILALALAVLSPSEPYQCVTDLECELAHPGTEVTL